MGQGRRDDTISAMRVFGLTGNIGSGKSTVAAMLREAGIPVLDADRISREVTAPGGRAYDAVVQAFGGGIVRDDGSIDRVRLGEIVFSDPASRERLERITHPAILEAMKEAVAGVVKETDLLVSTVLVAGERAPRLVTREMIRSMRPGAVAVDIAIDQGGSLETSRPTTHAAPYFIEEGVVHYCVTNMPAAVPRTSTQGLANAVLPFLLSFARNGVVDALRSDDGLLAGLNTHDGRVTCAGVAKAFGKPFLPAREAIG